MPRDSKNQFYAFFRFLSETMHTGAWPFWNPYHYSGHPSAAHHTLTGPLIPFGARLQRPRSFAASGCSRPPLSGSDAVTPLVPLANLRANRAAPCV